MSKVVITAPSYDVVTRSGYPYFTRFVADAAREKGFTVLLLDDEKAVRSLFEEACLDPDVKIITGMGHGNKETFTGQDDEILLYSCSYDRNLVKDKCVTHLSCSTGMAGGLLEDVMTKGAAGSQGYRDVYYFLRNEAIEDPLQDPICDAFLGSDVLRHLGLIEGKSLESATESARVRYMAKALEYDLTDPEVGMLLRYDAGIMVVYTGEPPKYCWLPGFIRRLIGCPH